MLDFILKRLRGWSICGIRETEKEVPPPPRPAARMYFSLSGFMKVIAHFRLVTGKLP